MAEDEYAEYLAKLEELGLSPYEAKAYLGLIRGGEITAIQVSEISGVPKTRVYDILMTLERKGFCQSHPGKVTKYLAIAPEIALKGYIETMKQQLNETINRRVTTANFLMEKLKNIGSELVREATSSEFVWVLKDPNTIAASYADTARGAELEIITLEKAPYAPSEVQYFATFEALEKGVKVRSIYQSDPESLNPKIIQLVKILHRKGGDIRFIENVPCKFALFDNKEVWLALQDPLSLRRDFVALVIKHLGAVKPFKELFDRLYADAIPYENMEKLF
ncbi:MAG: TrmB family transcriptional regulator [Thermoplasmata archaeon]